MGDCSGSSGVPVVLGTATLSRSTAESCCRRPSSISARSSLVKSWTNRPLRSRATTLICTRSEFTRMVYVGSCWADMFREISKTAAQAKK